MTLRQAIDRLNAWAGNGDRTWQIHTLFWKSGYNVWLFSTPGGPVARQWGESIPDAVERALKDAGP